MESDTLHSVGIAGRSLRLWCICLIETAFFIPLLVPLYVFLAPEWIAAEAFWTLPAVSLAGVLLQAALHQRLSVFWKRLAAALLLGAAFAAVFMAAGEGSRSVFNLPLGVIFAFQGVTSAGRKNRQNLYWCGVVLYLLAGIAFPRFPRLEASMPLITWAGIACLAWALFAANRDYLRYSTLSGNVSGSFLPRGLRRHNALWIGGIVLAAVLLAAGVGRWLGGIALSLLRLIVGWLSKPGAEAPPKAEQPAEPPPMDFPVEEPREPGWLSEILDMAFYVLGTAAIAALLALGAYWLYRNAGGIWRRWLDRLLTLLSRTAPGEAESAFTDEETRLAAPETAASGWRSWRAPFASRFGKRERWDDLADNRERARYLYRRMLKEDRAEGGYEPKPYFTPLETEDEIRRQPASKARDGKPGWKKRRSAADDLLGLYYRARYAEEEPRDEEIAAVKRELYP
ncbi:DUF4129 domain-containing protein [Paenibacillus sp. M1]|uniref:DUF4129 domain-containing protein n=1 Tax=Paenibacillus haidiansis TaxID=1574488 RepID=A0ABU7VRK1_9BACL